MAGTRIRAAWMRGGTSKGVFFVAGDLPPDAAKRDRILARLIGSPDPYGRQIDGLGGATSSTSKVVIVGPSDRPGCDVDYRFGQVPLDRGEIDWSGNCGNLTAAVGPFAIARGLVAATRDGIATVRIWQANVGKRIDAHVPMCGGEVVEAGDFLLDGVAFPSAEIGLDFLDPAGSGERGIFPAGGPSTTIRANDRAYRTTLIDAGNPLVLVDAAELGVDCRTLPQHLNADSGLLDRCEALRIAGAVAMGLVRDADSARRRAHTPKLALLAPPLACATADGRALGADDIDLATRVLSMGQFHHAIPGTAAIAIAAAAHIAGTVAADLRRPGAGLGVRLGHPSGRTVVGITLAADGDGWRIERARMSRSARLLMDGTACLPD